MDEIIVVDNNGFILGKLNKTNQFFIVKQILEKNIYQKV